MFGLETKGHYICAIPFHVLPEKFVLEKAVKDQILNAWLKKGQFLTIKVYNINR
jgi:hypothetical protein